ncbi:MAG: hypothetical protein H7Z75_09105 [Ferruginibacter sp.]|nr:hypothetical protein [Cytophagales bacterium]
MCQIPPLHQVTNEETRPLFKILNEDRRATCNLAAAAMQPAQASMLEAQASYQKAENAWELVIITRNQITCPWWKKLLGTYF